MSKKRKIENLKKKLLRRKYTNGNYPKMSFIERSNVAKSEAIEIIEGRMKSDIDLE